MKVNYKKILRPLTVITFIFILIVLLIDFFVMPLYIQKGKTTKVPNVVGLSLEEAQHCLRNAGLDPKIAEYKTDKRYEVGVVTLQNPIAEAEVKFERGIYLTVSGGEEYVMVPNLKGKSIREATFNLERFGLKLGSISYEPSDEIFANTIIRQETSPNLKVKNGTVINIIVSQGRASDTHLVPDVVLHTLSEAEKKLVDNGFRVGKITYQVNLDLLPNTVLEQYPRVGELMPLGQSIDLIVAQKADKKNKLEN